MLKKYRKQIANGAFLLILFYITFRVLLKDQELTEIFAYMKSAKTLPLLTGLGLLLIYIGSEALIIHHLMRKLDNKLSMGKCLKYSFIGLFFSAVTPSASGGQPMQVYYMKRDDVNVAQSSLVLIIITIAYKVVLLILGVFAVFLEYGVIRENVGGVRILVIIGFLVNIVFVAFLLILLFKQSFAKRNVAFFILWLGKHKIIKKYDRFLKKVIDTFSKYDYCAEYVRNNKKILWFTFAITFIQRISLFLITFLVYKSFGLYGASMYEIVALQTVIALAADSLPLPGGIGISESSFIILFDRIFGKELVFAGMLLSRGLTYYLLLFLSAAVTFWAHLFVGHKTKKEWGKK